LILLGDESKNPSICGRWREVKERGTQTREELQALFERAGERAANWGPICGVADLFSFDFDWPWVYGLWVDRFKERALTLTYQTPNGGARVFFYTVEKPQGDPFKTTLHVEYKASHYVAVGGEARTVEGEMRPYKRVGKLPLEIRRDDEIIGDTTVFFKELLEGRYRWLRYKCVASHLTGKRIELNHDQGLAINAFMLHSGCEDWEIHNFRRCVYDSHGKPDYDEDETRRQIENGRRYIERGGLPYPCRPSEKNQGLAASFNFDPEQCPGCPRRRERPEGQADGGYFDGKGRFIPMLLAEDIMDDHRFVTMMDNEEIYVYVDGCYQPLGEVLIKKECRNRLRDEYRRNRATEVIDYIKASTYTPRREEPPHLIPLENGVLDVSEKPFRLKPHSPDYMFFNKIPVKYDPAADCPLIKQFHREISAGEEDVRILEEVMGFCLYRVYFIAKALMLVGEGSNGKSTWLSLVKRFLGPRNVSGRSLFDLEEHRFAKADLHGKLANIYADLPDRALYRTGMFKMLTGRDLIAAEKKFRDTFHYVNYAKLLFSANKVPEAYDDTAAFFRRWIIIVFPNTFTGDRADPHILDRLTTPEELSGLLNLALAGLKRLLENGEFSHSKTTEEIKDDYIRKSSPIAAFIMDCLDADPDAFIVKKELYNVFTEYCRRLKLPTVTQDTFFKNMPQHAAVADYRPKVEGRRYYTFKGIRYRPNVSNLSKVSRAFYTLIEKRGLFKDGYQVEELKDRSFIKIGIPLDRVDRLDDKETDEAPSPPMGPLAEAISKDEEASDAASLQERMERVLNELRCFDDKVSEYGLNRRVGMDSKELHRILEQLEREKLAFRPVPGYWRAAL